MVKTVGQALRIGWHGLGQDLRNTVIPGLNNNLISGNCNFRACIDLSGAVCYDSNVKYLGDK